MVSIDDRQQILDTARELYLAAESITIDQIDANFYWRYCKPGLVERALESVLKINDEYLRLQNSGADKQAAYLAAIEQPREAWSDAAGLVPGFNNLLVENGNVAYSMRGAWFGLTTMTTQLGKQAQIRIVVQNSEWSGEQVETELVAHIRSRMSLEGHVKQFLEELAEQQVSSPPETYIKAEYFPAGEYSEDMPDFLDPHWNTKIPFLAPVVTLTVKLPLPFPGIISAFYEGEVRGRGWHELLYGKFNERGKRDVAIRTWAVALLNVSGLSVESAMQLVSQATGIEAVSETSFNRNRADIASVDKAGDRPQGRVPEAYYCITPRGLVRHKTPSSSRNV